MSLAPNSFEPAAPRWTAENAGLPGRLGHAWDIALQGQFPEAQAADAELAHISARPSAQMAAVMLA
jgi:hypothetical protein